MKDDHLRRAVEAALYACLKIKKGESLLIVSNPDTEQELIANAILKAASNSGVDSELILQPVKSQTDFAEEKVLEAIARKPSAVVSLSKGKLGKDPRLLARPAKAPDGRSYDHIFNYLLYGTKEIRAFWSPGASLEMFMRTVAIDYEEMRERAAYLAFHLADAEAAHISSESGTDLVIGLAGRRPYLDVGNFSSPGSGGNLPAGEVFVSPALRSAEGEIDFDGSIADIAGDTALKNTVRCSVRGGFVVSVDGAEEARRLEKALLWGMNAASELVKAKGLEPETALRYATNARHIGEFGIGLNTEARITGNMLEDEKVYGTCHFALGSNYDEDAPAMIHLDGLVKAPTVALLLKSGREMTVMEGGKIAQPLSERGA